MFHFRTPSALCTGYRSLASFHVEVGVGTRAFSLSFRSFRYLPVFLRERFSLGLLFHTKHDTDPLKYLIPALIVRWGYVAGATNHGETIRSMKISRVTAFFLSIGLKPRSGDYN